MGENLMRNKPLFSVIIPTCNRNIQLASCLDLLAPGCQMLSLEDYEIIVTDDGESNNASEFIKQKYPWAKWVSGPKKGPAANRNNGARYAAGEWLVFTDDDCLPDYHWLKFFDDAIIENPQCLAFEGAIFPNNWNLLKKDMAECPVNDKGGCFWSANILVQKKCFWSIGGFDERFKIAAQEDQDIYIRLRNTTSVLFVKCSFVLHPVRQATLVSKIRNGKKNLLSWYIFRNKYKFLFKETYFLSFKKSIISTFISLKKFQIKKVLFELYSICFLILAFPVVINVWKQAKTECKSPEA